MNTSKHIFVQIDTDSIVALSSGSITINNNDVLDHTLIYNQGSMALGSAVKDFNIIIEPGDQVTFTILPLKLFTNHTLTFTEFIVPKEHDYVHFECSDTKDKVSFTVTVGDVEKDCNIEFSLDAVLNFKLDGIPAVIPICIDPVLKAKQGRGIMINE